MIKLHPYQEEIVTKIQDSWKSYRRVLLQMPTGTGKTHVFCEIIRQHRQEYKRMRILVLTHKRELVYQTTNRLKQFGIIPGVIMTGEIELPEHQIQVATVQTLIQRNNSISFLHKVSLIVVDEAHHTPSDTYRKLIDLYSNDETHLLGVTATPRRSDGRGFADIFQYMVQSWQIKRFIEEGYLSDVVHRMTGSYRLVKKDLENVPIDGLTNDYDTEELERVMTNSHIMADAVFSYNRYRSDKTKSIVFAVTVAHSKELANQFNNQGIPAAHLDGSTPKRLRERILDDFQTGSIKVLCNVGIVTEGFDCPDAEIVQLLRPTKSITVYLQQVGRILRRKEKGGNALILDSACCYDEFGSVKSIRRWSLDPGPAPNRPMEKEGTGDMAIEPETDKIIMPVVDDLLPSPLYSNGKSWLTELQNLVKISGDIPKYQAYFRKNFSHFNNEEQLCRAIYSNTNWNLYGLGVSTISPFGELINTETLNIVGTKVNSLRPVIRLSRLSALYAANTPIERLRLPRETSSLTTLSISRTNISDISLISEYTNLQRIMINSLRLNNTSYDSLSRLRKLRKFTAKNSNFKSLKYLLGSKDKLEILELSNSELENLDLIHHFQKLRYLDISNTLVSTLGWLIQCRKLEIVVIKGLNIPRNEIKELDNRLPVIWVEYD